MMTSTLIPVATRADVRFAVGQCELGALLVAWGKRGISAIDLGDGPEEVTAAFLGRFPEAVEVAGDPEVAALLTLVARFVEHPGLGLELPLDIRGTAFEQRVWAALRQIPAGETASYREVAHRIGSPEAVRAVARACAANRLAVAIPCHRVIASDGSLSGYRWGVERKQALLARERRGTGNGERGTVKVKSEK